MYAIKINGERYNVPSEMKEVNFGRFLALRKFDVRDPLQLIYWALNAQPVFEHKAKTEREIANLLTLIDPLLSDIWEFMQSKDAQQAPDEIVVKGKTFALKGGFLNELPYWPYVVCKTIYREEMAAAAKEKRRFDATDRYNEIIAHYLYNEITGQPYLEDKAEKFISEINELPFTDCIKLGGFFLKKLKG